MRTIGALAGVIVVVAAWRLLSGSPEPAQALRGSPAPSTTALGPKGGGGEVSITGSSPVPGPPASRVESPILHLTVQVASFRTRNRAERTLARASERTGLPGLVVSSRVDGEIWQRILLGAFESEEEARRAVSPLLQEGFITELIVRPIEDSWFPALTGGDADTGER